MKAIRNTVDKLIKIPATPATPYPQVISWLFSCGIMLSFIYVCEAIGI